MKSGLVEIYQLLLKEYGAQNWWPVTEEGKTKPEYTGGPKNGRQRLEAAVGAILTQNTSWKNVEKAIENLNSRDLINLKRLKEIPEKDLQETIRPSGFFVQKANTIKTFVNFISDKKFETLTREQLLNLKGIGPETADSILLHACGKPEFVVDAYTKRIFSRLGLINTDKYEHVKEFFEKNLPKDVKLFQEYHALLVEHAKRFCRKEPECKNCPLLGICGFGSSHS